MMINTGITPINHQSWKSFGQDCSPPLIPRISQQFIRLCNSNDAIFTDSRLKHPFPIIQSLTIQMLKSGILPHTVTTLQQTSR